MNKKILISILAIILVACGGGGESSTDVDSRLPGSRGVFIGGNIGLQYGDITLSLSVNGSIVETKTFPDGNGFFNFDSKVDIGSNYSVEVVTNPQNRVCQITSNQTGMTPSYDVTNIIINCQEAKYFSMGAFGIPSFITIKMNGGEEVLVNAGDTEVHFQTPLAVGDPINLDIIDQPEGYECTIHDIGIDNAIYQSRYQYEAYCFELNRPVVKVFPSGIGFAAVRDDGNAYVWGSFLLDAESAQRSLVDIDYFSSSKRALTSYAVNLNGDLTGLNDEPAGESYKDVKHLMQAGVNGVWSNLVASSAVTKDGYLVSWGNSLSGAGGVYQYVGQDFTQVVSTDFAFAAIKTDGSVVAWGNSSFGGSTAGLSAQLQNVKKIVAMGSRFAALTHTGDVVIWPAITENQSVLDRAVDVKDIVASFAGIAAVKNNGELVVIGYIESDFIMVDGNVINTKDWVNTLTGVDSIFSNQGAYSILMADKTVISIGSEDHGGDNTPVESDLVNVKSIYPLGTLTAGSFAALKEDGTVITWGYSTDAGDSFSVSNQLTNVTDIYSTEEAYAALKADGSVVVWGNKVKGGSALLVQNDLVNVISIVSNSEAFAAIRQDGSVITWGNPENGGDSSSISKQLNR